MSNRKLKKSGEGKWVKDKYELTPEQNIFLAKKTLVNNIYNSARLEGCNITFPDTQTILDGVSVAGLKMQDVEVVLNLRDAWKFVLASIEKPLDIDYMCKINSYVSRNESLDWGVLRYGEVGITGTDYKPPVPEKDKVIQVLNKLLNENSSITEKTISLFLWSCRSQLFWDGNKRTSLIAANKLMISEGKGILMIDEKHLLQFNKLLTEYYITGNRVEIGKFLYENCIHGMTIDKELKEKYQKENKRESDD
jgi:hypothetical protein